MKTLAERLGHALKLRGKTPAELARATGKTESAVSQWLSGETKSMRSDSLMATCALLSVNAQWLATGNGEMLGISERTTGHHASEPVKNYAVANVVPAVTKHIVPLISWVMAGKWGDVKDEFQPSEVEEWIDAYESIPGNHAFALTVTGDSMDSPYPGSYTFPAGTVIIVDPDRAANAGDYVVAKDVATQQATFKKLVHDSGRWYLKALNPIYPMIEIDDPAIRVIGRVIEFRRSGKL